MKIRLILLGIVCFFIGQLTFAQSSASVRIGIVEKNNEWVYRLSERFEKCSFTSVNSALLQSQALKKLFF